MTDPSPPSPTSKHLSSAITLPSDSPPLSVVRKSVSVPVLRRTDTPDATPLTQNDPLDADVKLATLRSHLTDVSNPIIPLDLTDIDREEAIRFCDDGCLRRYLRARNWDVEKAGVKLRETVRWRVEYRPHELRNADLRGESKDGNNYINGFDKEGRPIVYLKKRGKAEDPYKNVQLLVLVLETAIKMMPPGVEKICLILDMGQYTRANSPPLAITRLTLNILSNHYPERLGVAYMINAPWIFNTLWSIVSPFLDTVTRNKVRFASVAETSRDVAKNPLLGGIEKGMLEKVYGGDLEFVYDDDEYWRDIETAISKK